MRVNATNSLKRGWLFFKRHVERNILAHSSSTPGQLPYWQDQLFTRIMVYLLPVCLLALIPGVIMSFQGGIPLLALIDALAAAVCVVIAFNRRLPIALRKGLLVGCLYLLAIMLLVYLGSFGPGLLYLLALSVFTALIFPIRISGWSVLLNGVICVFFGFALGLKWLNAPLAQLYTPGSWIAVSSNVILLSAASVAGLHLLIGGLEETVIRQITLQQQLQQEQRILERTLQEMASKNQELEQFAYIASHDLQEPLRTMAGIIALFEKQYGNKLEGNALKYLEFIAQSSARASALVSGLLSYARLGKASVQERTNLNSLLDDVLAELQHTIQTTQATLIATPLPTLLVYSNEFKRLLQNLVGNALKFTKPNVNPHVTITASEGNNDWTFTVTDNGIGVEEKFREKIFLIFQRLHPLSQYEGTGIGLAQCKKIVELHGGKIWVESIPDKGSTFYFTIPKL